MVVCFVASKGDRIALERGSCLCCDPLLLPNSLVVTQADGLVAMVTTQCIGTTLLGPPCYKSLWFDVFSLTCVVNVCVDFLWHLCTCAN